MGEISPFHTYSRFTLPGGRSTRSPQIGTGGGSWAGRKFEDVKVARSPCLCHLANYHRSREGGRFALREGLPCASDSDHEGRSRGVERRGRGKAPCGSVDEPKEWGGGEGWPGLAANSLFITLIIYPEAVSLLFPGMLLWLSGRAAPTDEAGCR